MKIVYWIFTLLAAGLMTMASIPDLLMSADAVEFFKHLGYPPYLLPFLGVAKMLGVVAILQPWFRGLKEWAYAGLIFDLIGALYSHLAVGDPISFWIFAVIGIVLVSASYVSLRVIESQQSV